MTPPRLRPFLPLGLALFLSACGGNNSSDDTLSAPPRATSFSAARTVQGGVTASTTADRQRQVADISHFLNQASFGANIASIEDVLSKGKAGWIEDQFSKPQTRHRDYVAAYGASASQLLFYQSFWRQARYGEDQLRQRVAFALSQIFVISNVDGNIYNRPAGTAAYYDTLGQYAFGNFRDLLQAVALHPMMGIYLSHLHNQKEDGARVPDENFAREVMQLMTIGLYQLNNDGMPKLSNGKPIETYTHDDVAGLAKVFTGWSWAGPDQSRQRFFGNKADPARDWTPMQMYPAYHSSSAKSFLGVTIGGGGSGEADLKVALDTLFKHPNVGPFISQQLIQRLVSSNPSRGYVYRVASVFDNNGKGVRGDMRAVIRAILLDSEASDNGNAKKLREPVLRLAHWMRAFNARSASGHFRIGSNWADPLGGIGQAVLHAPSVFNFYRPQYTPPNTSLSEAGKLAPEMQITGEPSVTGYLNFMQSVILSGLGNETVRDVQADYSGEMAIAHQPEALLDRLTVLLYGGSMSTTLRNQIIAAVNAINLPAATGLNDAQVKLARLSRVQMAIYLAMAAPEYIAQR